MPLSNQEQKDFELLDFINIIGFWLQLMNLEENLTQGDKQDIMDNLRKESHVILNRIEEHLQVQDEKIDKILQLLEKQRKD